MGLIGIGLPQTIGKDLIHNKFVIVCHTKTETIKLYYTLTDPTELLKELMLKNGIEESVSMAILSAAGKHFNAAKNGDSPASLAFKLPGVGKTVINPVTKKPGDLFHTIMDLNDVQHWEREKIADWIENVCDTKDITFQVPEGVKSEKGVLSDFAKVVTIESVL